jgi:hypothetical protein
MARYPRIKQSQYLDAIRLFHWATKEHFIEWFTGRTNRHRRTEVILPRLVRSGKIVSATYGKRKVYASKSRARSGIYIDHGLGCTEGLIRIVRARKDCTVVPERHFRGIGSVPEWGVVYPNQKMLLFEFSTKNNFEHPWVMANKINRYRENLPKIEEKFSSQAVVLFVLDINRARVESFIKRKYPVGDKFFFTDYETFRSVEPAKQITEKIYLWEDGGVYPLSK